VGLGLRHEERVPLQGQPAKIVGLRPRDVDRASGGERLVIEVKNLVVDALQGSLWDGDEPYQQVEAGPQPGLDQVRDVLEVCRDLNRGS